MGAEVGGVRKGNRGDRYLVLGDRDAQRPFLNPAFFYATFLIWHTGSVAYIIRVYLAWSN